MTKADRDQIETHFRRNMGRIMQLLALHGLLSRGETSLPAGQWPDLLRAAVMLLHATLEDLLRSVAEAKMPSASPRAFERIPFALTDKNREKLTLAELAEFRGKSVDAVIAESINKYLETATYNNVGDIVRALDILEVKVTIPGELKSKLTAMIVRRHNIAHRADLSRPDEDGARTDQPISYSLVYEWAASVDNLGTIVLHVL